ncbi:ceramide phosphoethanolamine synthase-like [Hetaerina americana]|uniref:ceramide phosphoethanolamine synthase-like n=1 Tax=Hetaerina americana TaxID=62018 RepID=UPI003A7F5DDF
MALSIWESRWLQLIAASILIYFIYMDATLYILLQSMPFTPAVPTDSPDGNSLDPMSQIALKTLLLDPPNHYIHLPLAVFFNEVTNFSKLFPSITPNIISISHVFVALCGMTMVWSDRLSVRQVGVLLFEVRSYLDALDGAVARSRSHHSLIHLDMGSSGFFIDGICDTFGSIALYMGVLVCLTASAPLLTHREKGGCFSPSYLVLPLSQTSKDSEEWRTNGGAVHSAHKTITHQKRRVLIVVICSALQMMIGSLFWNHTLSIYHSLLEINPSTNHQRVVQIDVFKSQTLWIIILCWRLCNPHALMEMILISIFIDRLWEFLRWTQYYGFVVIFTVTVVTQAHIHYVTSLMNSDFVVESVIGYK